MMGVGSMRDAYKGKFEELGLSKSEEFMEHIRIAGITENNEVFSGQIAQIVEFFELIDAIDFFSTQQRQSALSIIHHYIRNQLGVQGINTFLNLWHKSRKLGLNLDEEFSVICQRLYGKIITLLITTNLERLEKES